MIRQSIIISLVLLATMGAAHAQQLAATSDPAKKAIADPNERLCKEIATPDRDATLLRHAGRMASVRATRTTGNPAYATPGARLRNDGRNEMLILA